MKRIKMLSVLMLSACLLCACTARSAQPQAKPATAPVVQQQVEPTPQPEPEPVKLPPSQATLLAAGDNLIHDVIYWQAQARAADGGYDFLPVYSAVSQEIADADLAFINQETPIAASNPPSSYPLFNSPPQLAQNLAALGFDIVNLANNHMLDQGIEGLTETEQALRENNIPAITGTDGAVPVLEREGIIFSFIGFTEHTNGIPLPQGQEEKITYTDQPERMQQQVKEASQIADVAVVSVHWGQENSTSPTPAQRELAQQLADWGADIIIGTHPHVLQPVEQLTAADGRQVWVLYSLGNFVSAQADRPNLVGAMAEIAVEKDAASGEISISAPQLAFTVTMYGPGYSDLHLVQLSDYTDQLAAQHGVAGYCGQPLTPAYIEELLGSIFPQQSE